MTESIESRCGICCAKCDTLKAFGVECAGCLYIEKPFWGVCSVKTLLMTRMKARVTAAESSGAVYGV